MTWDGTYDGDDLRAQLAEGLNGEWPNCFCDGFQDAVAGYVGEVVARFMAAAIEAAGGTEGPLCRYWAGPNLNSCPHASCMAILRDRAGGEGAGGPPPRPPARTRLGEVGQAVDRGELPGDLARSYLAPRDAGGPAAPGHRRLRAILSDLHKVNPTLPEGLRAMSNLADEWHAASNALLASQVEATVARWRP